MSDISHDSLLKKHEDTVTYVIPDPHTDNDHWAEVGLYDWELDTLPLETPIPDSPTDEQVNDLLNHSDGVGFRIQFNSQKYKPDASLIDEYVKNTFETHSNGYSQNKGRKYRITNADPNEIRQVARHVALMTFTYWWWLEHKSDYDPYVLLPRREDHQPEIASVSETGDVHVTEGTGTITSTPYTLGDIELQHASDWQTPIEAAHDKLRTCLSELMGEYDYRTVRYAYERADQTRTSYNPTVTKTDARKQEDELRDALQTCRAEVNQIGRSTTRDLEYRFDSVTDLFTALQSTNTDRFDGITQITPERENKLVQTLIEHDYVSDAIIMKNRDS